MYVNSKKIVKILNKIAPENLAEKWDNVGFIIGNADSTVDRVMVALEVTEAVVEEAIHNNIDLIVCHHPLLFQPIKKVTENDSIGRMVRRLIKNDINLYVAHTNLDIAKGGTNDYLAEMLGIDIEGGLQFTSTEKYMKLAVYTPVDFAEPIRAAIADVGAGQFGEYAECAFAVKGEGYFKPLNGAEPHTGTIDKLERTEEIRLEAIVHESLINKAVEAMKKIHPYEIPAFDVWELETQIEDHFLGRTGYLSERMTLEALAKVVSEKIETKGLRYVGNPEKTIKKVALCTGAGSNLMDDAVKRGCDVLITGDLKYHEAQYAKQVDLCVIDAGHYETEKIYMKRLLEKLKEAFAYKEYDVAIVESKAESNPFNTV